MKAIENIWYSKHPLRYLLLPFSYLYRLLFGLHKLIYTLGLKKRYVSPIPVIVIGNITVGGTGKTPFTIALAKILVANGYQPGIVSRGYKGEAKQFPQWVKSDSDPRWVGDEPVLLAQQTDCPVVVAPKRSAAIKMLYASTPCDLILLDDGLQHHAIKKNIEIVLIDNHRKFGNGLCLPAGPLREPVQKLSKIHFKVVQDSSETHSYSMYLEPQRLVNLLHEDMTASPATFNNRQVHAVAAIGNPERFFNTLRQMGLEIIEHVFPDHHPFTAEDFNFCKPDDIVIMTQKDAVKCCRFAKENFWVLPVQSKINQQFITDFLQQVKSVSS